MSVVDVLRQILENALYSMNISSAGGDSPKINYVRDVDINPEEYDEVLKAEIRKTVKEIQEESGSGSPLKQKKPPKGMLFQILERDLGLGKARQAAALLSDPTAIVSPIVGKLMKGGGAATAMILAALASYPIIRFITKQLTKRGSLFDLTFRNIIDDRVNVLRTRESQQEIRRGIEGKSQLILTTRAGTVDPVFSWNSYEQINNNELEFEKLKQVRSNFTAP